MSAALAFALVVLALVPGGCRTEPASAPKRVLEREETVGGIPVRLKSELTPPRGTLGDPLTWKLTAHVGRGAVPESIVVTAPSPSLDLEAAPQSRPKAEREGSAIHRDLRVRGFDLGALPLPVARLPVLVSDRRDTLEFPSDTVFVDSLTPAASGSVRPDRGPIQPSLRLIDYIVAVAAAALLLAILVALVRRLVRARRAQRAPAPAAAAPPPEAVLLDALAALEREFPSLARDVFYERLSLALRAYTQAVTGVAALDSTTSELERELRRSAAVSAEGVRALIATLRRADLAKFARFTDPESEAHSILRDAHRTAGSLVAPAVPDLQPDREGRTRSGAGS